MSDPVIPPPDRHARLEGTTSARRYEDGSSSPEDARTDTHTYLGDLSEPAGRSFASTHEPIEAILRLILTQLDLRSSFLTRIDREECHNEVLLAHNLAGGSDVQQGALLELPQTF